MILPGVRGRSNVCPAPAALAGKLGCSWACRSHRPGVRINARCRGRPASFRCMAWSRFSSRRAYRPQGQVDDFRRGTGAQWEPVAHTVGDDQGRPVGRRFAVQVRPVAVQQRPKAERITDWRVAPRPVPPVCYSQARSSFLTAGCIMPIARDDLWGAVRCAKPLAEDRRLTDTARPQRPMHRTAVRRRASI